MREKIQQSIESLWKGVYPYLVAFLGIIIGMTLMIVLLTWETEYNYLKTGYTISNEFLERTKEAPQKDISVSTGVQESAKREPRVLGSQEIIDTITRFFGSDAKTAIAIAKAESGLNPKAVNINKNGSKDCNIFQINSVHNPTKEQCENPEENIKLAKKIYDKSGFTPWVAYTSKSYLKHYEL